MTLTRDPNLDLYILTLVNFTDLKSLSLVNRYIYGIIQSQEFWKTKLITDFSEWEHDTSIKHELKLIYLDLFRRDRIKSNMLRFSLLLRQLDISYANSYYRVDGQIQEIKMDPIIVGDVMRVILQKSNYESEQDQYGTPTCQDIESEEFGMMHCHLIEEQITRFNISKFNEAPINSPFNFHYIPSNSTGFDSYMDFLFQSKFFHQVIECRGCKIILNRDGETFHRTYGI